MTNMILEYKFRVIEKRQLAEQVFFYVLSLKEPTEINFLAGQFLNIKIGKDLWKPYSICSTPILKNKIELVIDLSPRGEGSAFFEKLNIGDEVLGSGPIGIFTVNPPSGEASPLSSRQSRDYDPLRQQSEASEARDLIFIATGSGIAPIRSIILDLIGEHHPAINNLKKIMLFFGLRHEEDIYFFEEFEKLEKENSNFKFYGTLSKPEGSWQGLKGRVTEHLEKIGDFTNKDFYLCGAPETVNALKIYLVSSGVKEENIHYEQY